MFRLAITCSAALALVAAVCGGSRPSLAAENAGGPGLFGAGQDRVCSVLIDKTGKAVMKYKVDDAVHTLHTHDCPEAMAQPVAQIAPAAPPEALPASGVVYFDFDKANLNPKAETTLNSIIADIKGRDLGGITVGGHTDTAGPPTYNMQLSQRRANTVAAELVKAGIPAHRHDRGARRDRSRGSDA